MVQDIKHGLRSILMAKTSAAAAILSLAVGVGANTAMFTVVNAVILQPLPFPAPERLVLVGTTATNLFSVPSYVALRESNHGLESLGAYETADVVLSGSGSPAQLQGQRISPEIVSLLGFDQRLRPSHGRMFAPEEFSAEGSRVLLISERLWQHRFGRDPGIIGRSVLLDGQPHTIIGITPARFTLFPEADLLLPLSFTPAQLTDQWYRRLEVMALLPAGTDLATAQPHMTRIFRTIETRAPNIEVRLRSLREVVVAHVDRMLFTVWAIAGLVLLIGCVNFANLLLARSVNRQHEVTVRAALGARPIRIVRLMLTESVVLACVGAALGALLAYGTIRVLVVQQWGVLPRLAEIQFEANAVGFAIVLALTIAIVFGSIPAWRAARPRLTDVLNDSAAASTGFSLWRHHAGKSVLTLTQIGATLVLLIGAGLLAKSYWMLERQTPGYDPTRLLAVQFDLPRDRYRDDDAIRRFAVELTQKLEQLPGVRYVSATTSLPLLPTRLAFRYLTAEDALATAALTPDDLPLGYLPPPPPAQPPGASTPPAPPLLAFQSQVGPEFFNAMAIPIRRGRAFTARDVAATAPVAIVNETMARRVWGEANPIGKRIRTRPTVPWITVVGVVGDIRRFARDDQPRPEMFVPMAQKLDALGADSPISAQMRVVSKLSFAVRTSGAPELVADMLQREIAAIDPTLAVARLSTMQGVLNQAVAPRRFVLASFGAFAAIALLLAACGTYGVMSYLVHRRTQEFGLRLALGASRRHVMWLALSQGVLLAAGGIGLGLAAAVAGSRAVQSMLFRVEAIDAPSYAALTGVMLTVVLLASYLPARRALRVDPLTALRRE